MNRKDLDELLEFNLLTKKKIFDRKGHKITKRHLILSKIYKEPGKPMGYYSEVSGISKPNFSKVIDALLKEDFIEIKKDPKDRRKSILFVSEKGKGFFMQHEKYVYEVFSESMNRLSKEDQKIFCDSIKTAMEIVKKL